jgi:hypothetical protein
MKGYFQTTLLNLENTPFIVAKSSMCIPVSSQAFIEGNCDFLDTYSVIYYKIITLYLNGVFLKCI